LNKACEFQQTIESTPQPIQETPEAEFLSKGSQVYARLLRKENEISIYPIESYGIKAADPAINWLKGRFEAVAQKHPDFQYKFVEKDGKLREITINGNLQQFNSLKSPTIWALQKAADRQ